MSSKLVIVESPAKARTVGRFLGSDYSVKASVGHIRDLPQNRLGVDVANDFAPRYVVPQKKKEVVKGLRQEVKTASEIYLATDPDREGEAIAWHLAEALKLKNKTVHRVVFHEITQDAVAAAFGHPRAIDIALVEAQQARRILDRLVGYTLSPLLRSKVYKKGLSAGRVQSVAVRLVVEREREIQAFVPVEYWSLEADLAKRAAEGKKRAKLQQFRAALAQIGGQKAEIGSGEDAKKVFEELQGATYAVADVRRKEVQRNPSPPFTTSTMQQEASRKAGFTARRTMAVAQQLYEGVSLGGDSIGLITYMRTDSTNLAESAVKQARDYIEARFGPEYVPARPRVFKTKSKGAQEAHEAVRPTDMARDPDSIKEFLSPEQLKLYRLVWQRAVACQMASAVMDSTSVDIVAGPESSEKPFLFRATGSVVKFPGFTLVYTEGKDEGTPQQDEEAEGKRLPALVAGEQLDLLQLVPEQHFTQPPPRFSEATLVKALEENGIGRPSTYAPTMTAIQVRGYVERTDKRLAPTEIGIIINDLLVEHFPEIVDLGFTAGMEEELDKIASGERQWVPVLREFYDPFEKSVQIATRDMPMVDIQPEPTGELCEKCGSPFLIKYGRFGKFIACSGYPKCRNAKSLEVRVGVKCPECGGEMVEKKTRRKRIFYSCNRYPTCVFAIWQRPVPQPCGSCGGLMTQSGKGAKCSKCGEEVESLEEQAQPVVAG